MRGWITDCHPSDDGRGVVVWIRGSEGHLRLGFPLRPSFFVSGEGLASLSRDLEGCGATTEMRQARTRLGGPREDVLMVSVEGFQTMARLARAVDRWGGHRAYELYNVDLSPAQRFMLPRGLFPFGLVEHDGPLRAIDSPQRINYPVPPLLSLRLEISTGTPFDPLPGEEIRSLSLDGEALEGDEEGMLRRLSEELERRDPDVLLVDRGDKGRTAHLLERAEHLGLGLALGRDRGVRAGGSKSYHSYGTTVYKPPALKLNGRIHLDTSSFMHSEGGLPGLIELSRLSGIPLQDLSRLSPGSAISAMQSDHALKGGHLLRWKKNMPEDFKTLSHLVACDRGGMIHQPRPGVHEDVVGMDFSSMYPSIISRFNISPETLECACCPRSEAIVPGIGHRICQSRRGLLPEVIGPVVERRRALKAMARRDPLRAESCRQRSSLLKWILVTCFGYTGYRNARFGRIECHEAITAYGREIMLRASEMAAAMGFKVLHGIVDSLWLQGGGDPDSFAAAVMEEHGIPLETEGRYRWIVFLPNLHNGAGALNRYYGLFEDGEIKMRGIAARKRDCVPMVRDFQVDALEILSEADGREGMEGRLPQVISLLNEKVEDLRHGAAGAEDLTVLRRISRPLGAYRQFNDGRAAAELMAAHGHEPRPGQSVAYIVRDSSAKAAAERVAIPWLWDGVYDAERYAEMLLRAAEEILVPLGWDRERLRRVTGGQSGRAAHQCRIA